MLLEKDSAVRWGTQAGLAGGASWHHCGCDPWKKFAPYDPRYKAKYQSPFSTHFILSGLVKIMKLLFIQAWFDWCWNLTPVWYLKSKPILTLFTYDLKYSWLGWGICLYQWTWIKVEAPVPTLIIILDLLIAISSKFLENVSLRRMKENEWDGSRLGVKKWHWCASLLAPACGASCMWETKLSV